MARVANASAKASAVHPHKAGTLLCLCWLALSSCTREWTRVEAPLRVEDLLAELPSQTADGAFFDRGACVGKPWLFGFFATWSFPSLMENRSVSWAQRRWGPEGLCAVLVALDLDGEQMVAPYVRSNKLDVPVLVASEALRQGNSRLGAVRQLPFKLLFSKEGVLLESLVGNSDPAHLERSLEKAVGR